MRGDVDLDWVVVVDLEQSGFWEYLGVNSVALGLDRKWGEEQQVSGWFQVGVSCSVAGDATNWKNMEKDLDLEGRDGYEFSICLQINWLQFTKISLRSIYTENLFEPWLGSCRINPLLIEVGREIFGGAGDFGITFITSSAF